MNLLPVSVDQCYNGINIQLLILFCKILNCPRIAYFAISLYVSCITKVLLFSGCLVSVCSYRQGLESCLLFWDCFIVPDFFSSSRNFLCSGKHVRQPRDFLLVLFPAPVSTCAPLLCRAFQKLGVTQFWNLYFGQRHCWLVNFLHCGCFLGHVLDA